MIRNRYNNSRINENSSCSRLRFDEATPLEISDLRLDHDLENIQWTAEDLGDWSFLIYAGENPERDYQPELYFNALNVELNHGRSRMGEIYYMCDLAHIDKLDRVANNIWMTLCEKESMSGLDRRDIERILREYGMHDYRSSYPWHI